MGYPEPAERNTTWIKPIIFNSKCFKCKHFPMIRRQCCKKCNYTFILMSPFICPSCTHIFIIIVIMENCTESHGNKASALSRRNTQFPSFCDLLYWWSKEEELQEEIKRKTRKIIISVNHQYFLGGCLHGVNKLVGRSAVSPILLLPPTVYSLSSLSSPQTGRAQP